MELRYASNELERQCTNDRYMQRKLGVQVAKSLRLRLAELRRASEPANLLLGMGKWEAMTQDRLGQWSAHLTKNWRLIVEPEDNKVIVKVVEIEDYHKR